MEIATHGALSDVPSDTKNVCAFKVFSQGGFSTDFQKVLAWNGGGSSNYSDITHQGGYDVLENAVYADIKDTISSSVEKLEEAIEDVKSEMESLPWIYV